DNRVVPRALSGAGACNSSAARRRADLFGHAACGDGHTYGGAAGYRVRHRVWRHSTDEDRANRLRRGPPSLRGDAQCVARPGRRFRCVCLVAYRHGDRGGDRRHESADLRRPDGQAARPGGARRVLYGDSNEKESARHTAFGDRDAGDSRKADVNDLPRDDDHWRQISRHDSRVPRPRHRKSRDTLWAHPVQGGPARRRSAERRTRVRRLLPSCERDGQERQGDPGRRHESVARHPPPMNPFYITTPIYYINAQPHIGHAYTTMVADAIARSRRLLGDDVFFLTGTDEHGQKVERAAQKAGLKTEVFAENIAASFREMCRDLNISNNDFIRTTEPRHHRASQELWRRVAANGDIYKGDYEGWYCTVDEIFVPESQLVEGKCPTCGNKVERLKEESYYFRLSEYP